LQESAKTLDEWYALSAAMNDEASVLDSVQRRELYSPLGDALCDDLNTPRAIAELHQLRNAVVHGSGGAALVDLVKSLRFLGFLQSTPAEWDARKHAVHGVDAGKIDKLIDARNAARKTRNFKEADRIRDELKAMDIELEDHKDGTTTWKVKR
jgi:cysteinyl-tRNA synthetase